MKCVVGSVLCCGVVWHEVRYEVKCVVCVMMCVLWVMCCCGVA